MKQLTTFFEMKIAQILSCLFLILFCGSTFYGQTKSYPTSTSNGIRAWGLASNKENTNSLIVNGIASVTNISGSVASGSYKADLSARSKDLAGLGYGGEAWVQFDFGNIPQGSKVYIPFSEVKTGGVGLDLLGTVLGLLSLIDKDYLNATVLSGDTEVKDNLLHKDIVVDKDGKLYLVVSSDTAIFDKVRFRLKYLPGLLSINLGSNISTSIGNAYYLSNLNICNPVAFASNGEASGVDLDLGALVNAKRKIVENPENAINGNSSSYSTLSGGLLAVAGTFSQSFYFPTPSEANSKLKVRLQLSKAVADVNLIGGYFIKAYNGTSTTPVFTQNLQGGLIGGIDLLGLLNSGGVASVILDIPAVYDRVEIGLQGALNINVGTDLRIYEVSRTSVSCPPPPPAANPLFNAVCANGQIVSSKNTDDPQNAVDPDFDSYATIRSDAGVIGGLGSSEGHLEVKFDSPVPAGKTTYVRIDYDTDVLNSLLAGSLGGVVSELVNVLLLGNHSFEIQLKNGSTEILNTSSKFSFSSSNGQVKLVQDKEGRYYLAIKSINPFTNIRITDKTVAGLGLLSSDKYLNVYSICFDDSEDECHQAFSTSYDGNGLTLELLKLGKTGVTNAHYAIDDSETTFSEINLGTLSIAGFMSQNIYYNSLSDPHSVFKIKIGISASQTLNVDLLAAYEVLAYNGANEVYRRSLSSGLLNGTDVLNLIGGQTQTITFAPGKAYDRIEIRVNGLLNVSAFDSSVKVYDVKRFGANNSTCPDPDFVLPPSTEDPFEASVCTATIVDSKYADYPWLAADGNNESYATLTASSGALLGIGGHSGFLEYEFSDEIPANKTTYIRIDMEGGVLEKLLGGTLGKLITTVGGLVIGNHYFEVEAKMSGSGTPVLKGSSQFGFLGTTGGDLRLVQDNIGRYYIAVTPTAPYKRIKISEHFPAIAGVTKNGASMKIFEACHEIGTDACFPAQFTSYDQIGFTLGVNGDGPLNGAGVINADHAISVNSSDYSEISTGTVAIVGQVVQHIYFNESSTVGDELKVRVQMKEPTLLTAQLLGRYKIVTYNKGVEAETFIFKQGVINELNLLNLFKSGGVQTLTYMPTKEFDRVDVVVGSLVDASLNSTLRLYGVKRISSGCPISNTPSPFENPTCALNILDASNADDITNLFDDDFDSYATLNSGAGFLLGLGNKHEGFVELGFDAPVPTDKTAYIRIDYEPTLLNALLGGSLGGALAALVDGILLGNHYFSVEVKDGETSLFKSYSNNGFLGNTEKVRIIQDAAGRYYIAVTAGVPFTSIKITDHTNSAVGFLAKPNTMNVYGVCFDSPLDVCGPAFATSFDGVGLTLDVAGLSGVKNGNHAIDTNTTSYSEISMGTVAAFGSIKQLIFFNHLSKATDEVEVKIAKGAGVLDVGILGSFEIKAYKGVEEVAILQWNNGLINGINVLNLLNTGNPTTIPFRPGVPFDRISVGLKTFVEASVVPNLRLYGVTKVCKDFLNCVISNPMLTNKIIKN